VIQPRLEDIAPAPGSSTTVGRPEPGAAQVQAVSADVDQLTGHRVGVGVHRFPHRLVAAADGERASTAITG
jgi:hypothetical protein